MASDQLIAQYSFRDDLTVALIEDLVGPSDPHEIIADPPITHYLAGVLHPRMSEPDQVPIDAWGIEGVGLDDEGESDATTLANARYPSSMGLTFAVQGDLDRELALSFTAATYTDTGDGWQRTPLDLAMLAVDPRHPNAGFRTSISEGLEAFVRVREADPAGRVSITVAMINHREAGGDRGGRDASAFFQPQIFVRIPEDSSMEFVDRSEFGGAVGDSDVAAGSLLFRHVSNLAVGHGCSVEWDNSSRPVELRTTFIPVYDLPLSDSNQAISGWFLDMRQLSARSRPEVIAGLNSFVDGYEHWVAGVESDIPALGPSLQPQARAHITECREAVRRLRAGIGLLGDPSDDRVFRAFLLMNQAMVEQRVRSERVLAGRIDLSPSKIPAVWRPFQLAFVLLCLQGVAVPESEDREVADLLWFPTGGGKTEAYLGIIAFTLFLRRLRGRGRGVAALMRYTLRLLTAQQFERAALLMCCCEAIRRQRSDLGADPFEVGLYVGRAASPLSVKEAKRALDLLAGDPEADTKRTGNPIQIKVCVWCGSRLGVADHKIRRHPDRCVVECPDESCEFSSGLPWWVVDEDVYRERPALIIGTVDKLAGIAWRDSAGALFNRGDQQDPGLDLIIQDELHLISGPLGTLTGLYEVAVDSLATSADGTRPKVIASTATIRRATAQVRAVFDREVAQFPPPALDSRDSYFAMEAQPDVRGTRRYVGLMAPGTSQSTLLVRTYARLLYEAVAGDYPDGIRDTFWTLVGYFNSLRVLAGAHLQVLDDVADRMSVIGNGSSTRTPGENLVELTSRSSSSEIATYLRQLRLEYGQPGCVDVVLATNMISVGVDVDRLGLMTVMGQPQATAEYIQATSRVGRRNPGLVVVLYNAARSRDRSHYEGFVPYHSMLYRQVEATSATPFSPRARDRALHAVLVALVRHKLPGMRTNADARNIDAHLSDVSLLMEAVVQRSERTDKGESSMVRAELLAFVDHWRRRANGQNPLSYRNDDEANPGLLISADEVLGGVLDGEGKPTLWSMRDVDRVSQIYEIGAG
jgi:hypothetical protein